MARVKRNEIEMERKNNAKEEEIQQVLQDRYNAEQAKIENKRQESNAILKLNKELAEIRTKNEKQQRQDEHAADKAIHRLETVSRYRDTSGQSFRD